MVGMSATLTDIYDLPQEHKDFRDTIRQIVDEKVRPRAAEIDATGEYPWDVRKLFGEQDILALPFEEQYGGTGTGTVMLQLAGDPTQVTIGLEQLVDRRAQRAPPANE